MGRICVWFEGADEANFPREPTETMLARLDLIAELSRAMDTVRDPWTEHFARLVEARNQEVAANPYGLQWEEDLEESLVRYGRNLGYSRVRSIPTGPGPGGLTLQDTRRVVGHHHPGSRGYLFPGEFLESPADVPPESWITAPQTSRTWYAPPYAPDFRGLETQVARFRRGDEMLVVGAYRPAPGGRDPLADLSPSGQPEDDFDSRSINLKPEPARRVGCCPGWVDYSVPGILIAPACPASRRAVASWPAW